MDLPKNDIILRFKLETRNCAYAQLLPEGYKNWQLWISPYKGFGQGYATISTCNTAFQLVTSEEGLYNVLAIGEIK